MIIEAINRNQIESYIPDIQNIVAICIYGSSNNDSPPKLREGWKDTLFLRFDDVDESNTHGLKLFDKDQAGWILDFIKITNSNKVIVSCHGGISRSVAVKLALEQIFNGVNLFLHKKYGLYNRHVASTIINLWEGR